MTNSGMQTRSEHPRIPGPGSQAILLVNPAAGRRKWQRPRQIRQVKDELERAGMRVAIHEVGETREGSELARDAIRRGMDLIIVCGGDGTINHVVQGMARSRVPLAILPGGTANMLAREMHIPLSIEKAARSILTSVPKRIALGRADGRWFISLAGAGLDASVVRKLNKKWKAAFGIGGYVLEAFGQFFFGPPNPFFFLSANGQQHRVSYACASKSQHYGPLRVLPEANPFSERFHVYAFPSQSRWRYLHYGAAILARRKSSPPSFLEFPAQRIDLEPIHPEAGAVYLQVDGEQAGQLPCSIEIVPDALTLLTPDPVA